MKIQRLNMRSFGKKVLVLSGAFLTIAGLTVFISSKPTEAAVGTGNLIPRQQWTMPGVIQSGNSLIVNRISTNIVNQNGTFKKVNYPVNLYGNRLAVNGNFAVEASVANISGVAGLELYSQPPIILDEDRWDPPMVRFAILGNQFWIGVKKGKATAKYKSQETFTFMPQTTNKVRLVKQGTRLNVFVNDASLGFIKIGNTFKSGQLWFGFDTNGQFRLDNLSADPLVNSSVSVVNTTIPYAGYSNPNGFQYLASIKRPGFKVGAAVSLGPLVGDNGYNYLAESGWYGSWTTENALKMQFVQPERGVFSFGEGDALVASAKSRNIDIHGHALVFGEANPLWAQSLAQTNSNQMLNVMNTHIATVAGHYAGKIKSWDVVNEPLADYDDFVAGSKELRQNIWFNSIGKDYIKNALISAHNADPNAKLFINDYGLEENGDRWQAMLKLVDELIAAGVPLDGIGFQTHVYEPGDEVNPTVLKSHFNQLAQRGLTARVSEMDVYGHNSAGQANQFSQILKACLDTVNCVSFNTWGINEAYSSTSWVDNAGKFHIGDGLPFNQFSKPLAAVTAMQNVLR